MFPTSLWKKGDGEGEGFTGKIYALSSRWANRSYAVVFFLRKYEIYLKSNHFQSNVPNIYTFRLKLTWLCSPYNLHQTHLNLCISHSTLKYIPDTLWLMKPRTPHELPTTIKVIVFWLYSKKHQNEFRHSGVLKIWRYSYLGSQKLPKLSENEL